MSEGDNKQERIRQRAYQLWVEDGEPEGKEKDHWERARAEIEGHPEATVKTPTMPPGTSFGP